MAKAKAKAKAKAGDGVRRPARLPAWFLPRAASGGRAAKGAPARERSWTPVPIQLDPVRMARLAACAAWLRLSKSDVLRLAFGRLAREDPAAAAILAAASGPAPRPEGGRKASSGSRSGVTIKLTHARLDPAEVETLDRMAAGFGVNRRDVTWHALDRLVGSYPALAAKIEAAERKAAKAKGGAS